MLPSKVLFEVAITLY